MTALEDTLLPADAMTTDDRWNQDHAWAEGPAEPAASSWTDSGEADWAEDIRSGVAYQMQGFAPSTQQSGLGIASLVLSIVAGLMIGMSFVVSAVVFAGNPNPPENDPIALGVGCTMLVGILLALLAGLLGLIGLFQPHRARTCAVLGVLFAGIEVFGLAGMVVLALLFG
jgi:hypothetical protein